jgi:hypothetical protein
MSNKTKYIILAIVLLILFFISPLFLFVVLIIAAVAYYFYKSSEISDPRDVKELYNGCTDEQKKVIRYLNVRGFLTKTISDTEYDEIARKHFADSKQKALAAFSLDESEVNEINPLHSERYISNHANYSKTGIDGKMRTNVYYVIWILFGSKQIFIYESLLYLDSGRKEEVPRHIDYQFTSLTTSSNEGLIDITLQSLGGKVVCRINDDDYTKRVLQGLNSKLKEVKRL